MDETTARTQPRPFGGEDWFDPLEGAVASAFVASSRRCWRPNWKRPCSAAAMPAGAPRKGTVTAIVSAN